MERKYRQKGYQDERNDRKEQPKEKKADSGYGPRPSPRIETRFTEIVRCSNCSAPVEMVETIAFSDQCKKCGAHLHSCKNCRYFDPGARFECQKPIEVRIARKADGNMCMQFATKVSIEKQQPQMEFKKVKETVNTAREAFDALFKK